MSPTTFISNSWIAFAHYIFKDWFENSTMNKEDSRQTNNKKIANTSE